jgi:hypothetical protein
MGGAAPVPGSPAAHGTPLLTGDERGRTGPSRDRTRSFIPRFYHGKKVLPLRLYSWQKTAISAGKADRTEDV